MTNNQKSDIPRHIVVFPDGNRRWAKEQGLDTLEGHKAGYENLLKFREWCQARGVQALTAFGFSTENWNRTEREVSYLMRLLESGLAGHFKRYMQEAALQEQGVRVRVIGQKARLPESLQKVIAEVEEGTKDNTKFFLNLGISYGGRWDIAQATRRIIKDGIAPEQVTEDLFASYLSTAGLPEPDLVIRAGGEHRFSNFVLWQAAYAELFFVPKYWPAFTEQDFDEVLQEYARRNRRFGK
ncbi:MAG TPA: polyprenyl diphosphate synthase [Candidatus Paceibacterota bacterium]